MSIISKSSAVLAGIILITTAALPVLAQQPLKLNQATGEAVKRPVLKEKVEIKKEIVTSRIEAAKEKIASRTAALKVRLEKFKDQKKAVAAQRINANLNTINQNQTSQMQKHLNTMSQILGKLENRINQETSDIKDPAKAQAAVISAKEAIATASAATSAQAEKDYTLIVSSESRIKTDAKTQRDKLHADLTAVRKLVITAKQSVGNAIRTAKSGPEQTLKEATISGEQ